MQSVQWADLTIAIICLGIAVVRVIRHPRMRLTKLPIIFFMLHAITFYVFIFLKNQGIVSIQQHTNLWSSVLRFHGLSTFLLLEAYGYRRDNQWKHLQ